jgi:hypothetical protein
MPGQISSLPWTVGSPPFISFSTSCPELNPVALLNSAARRDFVESASSWNVPFPPTDEGTKNVAEVSTSLRERVTVTNRPRLIG